MNQKLLESDEYQLLQIALGCTKYPLLMLRKEHRIDACRYSPVPPPRFLAQAFLTQEHLWLLAARSFLHLKVQTCHRMDVAEVDLDPYLQLAQLPKSRCTQLLRME